MAEEEDIEEERQKLKHELISGYLDLKTKKELEKNVMNECKIDVQWRHLMRTARTKDIKMHMEQLKDYFIKTVDLKDSIISVLHKNMAEIEVDGMRTSCAQMNDLAELIAAGEKRAGMLSQQYIKDMTALRDSFKDVQNQLQKQFGFQMAHFNDLDYVEDEVFKDFKLIAKTRFSIMKKDINVEITKEKEDIISAFDTNMSNVWQQFQSALVKYFEDADSMEKVFCEMEQEYQRSMQDTLQDRKITEELRKSIPQLRAHIKQRTEDYEDRMKHLLTSQDSFYHNVAGLKVKMNKTKEHDKTALTNLVVNSTAAIRELEKLHVKGEKIMRLYRRCEKLEAEAGDVEATLDEPCLSTEEMKSMKEGFEKELATNAQLRNTSSGFQYVNLLQGFWEKLNRVVLQNMALRREMRDLEDTHTKLKSNVDHFFQNFAENENTVSHRDLSPPHQPLVQEAALLVRGVPCYP